MGVSRNWVGGSPGLELGSLRKTQLGEIGAGQTKGPIGRESKITGGKIAQYLSEMVYMYGGTKP